MNIALTRPQNYLARLRAWYAISRSAFIGALIILILVLMTATVPLYSPYRPDAMDFMAPLGAPTTAHLLGTDNFGRDILRGLSTVIRFPWQWRWVRSVLVSWSG